ncbi:MAG TPA: cytochrome c3 family protein, partial [Candidatus Saccharimonadales bacterium]|nr:cytochrome c3 family protein [Candidatus Saccharimonadales bacterium]
PPAAAPSSRHSGLLRILLALALALPAASLLSPVRAQSNEDCLTCHEDPDIAGERNGKEFSVHVDAKQLEGSVHAELDCVMCHQDLAGADLPHEPGVAPVNCGDCHDAIAAKQARSLHGRAAAKGDPLAPVCTTCHGTHHVLSPANPKAPTYVTNVPNLCGSCHHEGSPVSMERDIPQSRILENYSLSIHGKGLFEKGLTVTAVCTSCHNSHEILPHTDPNSSINRANVAKTCQRCHARIEEVHRKVIEGRLWETEPHKIPACVDCHSPHKIRKVFYPAGMANKDCLRCHQDPNLTMTRDGKTVSLYVDEAAYAASKHKGTACAQCHTEVTSSRRRACETIKSKVNCAVCHAGPSDDYNRGIHGQLAAKNDPDAPVCIDCHSKHATEDHLDPRSPTYPRNVPTLCGNCHRNGEKAAVRIKANVPDIVHSYEESIHGKGLIESGLVVTATCADCHTPHTELPPGDPDSSVNSKNVADTCGRCHRGIEETFKTSIHWTAKGKTEEKLPTCEDCHTSHNISRIDKPGFRLKMMNQCGRCHQPEAATFFDTFHGKVSRLGSEGAAKCYDCHGTHNILPPSDPDSTLSRANVVKTCAQCHAGSNRRFAGYLTHATHHDPKKYPYLFWAFWGMTALLVGTLTFAMMHTLAWLMRLWLTRDQWRPHRAAANGAAGGKLYRRFTRSQRTMHLIMLVSFLTLALTGMTLKFSYMHWATVLSRILGGFETMGVLHRMGAITLLVVFLIHAWDVRRKKKAAGLSWWGMITHPDSIIFNLNDLKEAYQSVKWFFGLGPRPNYGRYTYWEKFDYFAVLWGIVVIGTTGLLLWFPEFFTKIVPGWTVNVATIIHSDEALLAVAFIFTIHFFNTHFRPDKFPMDKVMFTGRLTLDELKYDKPREYEELVRSGKLDEHMVDPLPKQVVHGFRIFGFIALAVGLTLIALIIYSMIFGYR